MTNKRSVASGSDDESTIYIVRGQKVMLGLHLAKMHRLAPQTLEQTIERNMGQFPEGSMFRLSPEELAGLKSQHAIPDSSQAAPYAFTAEGVAILSGILFDEREIHERHKSRATTCKCAK